MNIWKLLRGKKGETRRASREVRPALEQLEPRLLLNADFAGIEPILAPDAPSSEHAIYVDLDEEQAGVQQNLPTVAADPDQLAVTEVVIDFSQIESEDSSEEESVGEVAQPAEVGGPLGAEAGMEEAVSGSSLGQVACVTQAEGAGSGAISQEETVGPIVGDQQDVIPTSETPSIEIRGPPQGDSDSLIFSYDGVYSDNQPSTVSVTSECILAPMEAVAPDLPGLVLVDPDISNWQGQVIYLDFDGAEDVTYSGPVTVGPFDVPAFQAPGQLAGQEQAIINQVLANLQELFVDSGITFTTEKPPAETDYSTIYIGGDDSAFSQYGSFLGLAEQVDVGNFDSHDAGLVFSKQVSGGQLREYTATFAGVVAHEVGHLLGYAHEIEGDSRGPLAGVAETGTLHADPWYGEVDIPDNGGWDGRVTWDVSLSGAPSGAQVTDVDVFYDIDHTYVGDLKVWLTTERGGVWHDKLLFDRGGDPDPSDNDLDRTHTSLDDWDGIDPNGIWYLMAADYHVDDLGHIEKWEIWVDWETPPAQVEIRDFDCESEPWRWGTTAQVDIDLYNSGGSAADTWVKVIASNDTTLWDADDYVIHNWHAEFGPAEHWPKTDYTWTLPTEPYKSSLPEDGYVYYYLHVGDPFDLWRYDRVDMSPAEEGEIVSVSPSAFVGGQSTTVTVRVRNLGLSDDMFVEWDSKPDGWTISPKNVNPRINSGDYYDAQFTVTPPASGGSGAIVWKFYDDDAGYHPDGSDLLDTWSQSVSASSGRPDAPSFVMAPPSAIYPTKTYSVTVDYTDPNGRDDLQHLYLRLAQGDSESSHSQTLMHTIDTNWTGQWSGEGDHFSGVNASRSSITNGYRIIWTFSGDWSWVESSDVDFYAFAVDDSSGESVHSKYNRNACYENDLVIYGSEENIDPITLGETYQVNGWVIFEGTTSVPVLPDDWTGISVRMDEASVGGTNRGVDTSVAEGYALEWTPSASHVGSYTLYVYASNTNHQPPNNSGTYYDIELLSIQCLTITGHVTYLGQDGDMHDGRHLWTEVWEKDILTDDLIAEGYTDEDGVFRFTDDENGDLLSIRDSGTGESGSRDIYFKIRARNEAAQVSVDFIAGALGIIYWFDSDTEYDIEGPLYRRDFELVSTRKTDTHAAALGLPGEVKSHRDWLWNITSPHYARGSLDVAFPDSSWPMFSFAEFFWVWDYDVMRIPETWTDWNYTWETRPQTIAHEYGHAVHWALTDGNLPDGAKPVGVEDPNDGTSEAGEGGHYIYSESSEGFALTEGWAEFFACARYDDPAKQGIVGIETNDYWMGHDGNYWLGPNTDGNLGNIVEGAVASIFWDIWDGVGDDLVNGLWSNLWTIFRDDLPSSIWNSTGIGDFYHYWVQRYGQTREVDEIFIDHGIPVTDDSCDPNDSSASAWELADLQGTVEDLILADAADWFTFTTTDFATTGSGVSIYFDDERGDLDLYLYDSSLGLLADSDGNSDSETIDMGGRSPGTYYVRVIGSGGNYSPNYDLALDIKPNVAVSVSPASVAEDGAANLTYTFTRNMSSSSPLTVNFSVGGLGEFNTDYTQSGAVDFDTTSGTVIISAGSTTATVTINPMEDADVEPDDTVIFTITSGTGYTVGSPSAATGTILNDDEDVQIVANPTSLGVPEGSTATFQVRLSAEPSADVTVNVSRVAGDTHISILSGSSLTFTPSNWRTYKAVTLAAAQDADTTNGTATIRCSASGLSDEDVTATEQDDDVLQIVTNTSSMEVPEGSTNTFRVKLSAPPSSNVTVTSSWVSGDKSIFVSGGSILTFTPLNYSDYQTVTVTAQEDDDVVNNSATIRCSASGLSSREVIATEQDDDELQILTSASSVDVPEGSTSTFQARLSAEPSANLTVNVSRVSGDTDISVSSGSSLTFTPSNWSDYQTVTLSAAEDPDAANDTATIRCSVSELPNEDVVATEQDNDELLIATDVDSVQVLEGSTRQFQVRLSVEPTANLTVSVSWEAGDTDISVSEGSSLTFTPLNWSDYQAVTLSAAEDANTVNDTATIRCRAPGLADVDVAAVEQDNDLTLVYVDDDAPNDPGPGDPSVGDASEDGSREHPFDTIQEALGAVAAGGEIRVAGGTYESDGPVADGAWFGGIGIFEDVLLYGGYDGTNWDLARDASVNLAVVNGAVSWAGIMIMGGETPIEVVIDGFTITNGLCHGIDCSSAVLTMADCIVSDNATEDGQDNSGGDGFGGGDGAGIYAIESTLDLTRVTVKGNVTGDGGDGGGDTGHPYGGDGGAGGGICAEASDLTMTDCIVSDNVTGVGGGGFYPVVGGSGGHGGGIYITGGSELVLEGSSVVTRNATGNGGDSAYGGGGGHGGGIYVADSALTIRDSSIAENSTGMGGDDYGDGGGGQGRQWRRVVCCV